MSAVVVGTAGAAAPKEGGSSKDTSLLQRQRAPPKAPPPRPQSDLNMVLFPPTPEGTDGVNPIEQTWWICDKFETFSERNPVTMPTFEKPNLQHAEQLVASFRVNLSELERLVGLPVQEGS